MNSESTESETNSAEVGEDTVADRQGSNIVIEGEIVSDAGASPDMPDSALQQRYIPVEGRPSFVRTVFGGMVILTDELGELALKKEGDELPPEVVEAALQRAAEQQESLMEDRPFATLRYGAIGLLSGALDNTQSGAGRLSNIANRMARISDKVAKPVWNSFLLKPIRKPVKRVEQAAEEKVDDWIARGRVEEVRSRALAEVGINNFVDNSVTEISESEQIQMIVQQVIDGQSTGLLSEIIGQIRQRFVRLDMLFLSKLNREQVAAPDFRDAYLRGMMERRPEYQRVDLNDTMAGTYAGPIVRLIAFMIDLVVLLLAAGLASSFVSSFLALFDLRANLISFLRSGDSLAIITGILLMLTNFLIIGVYFHASWYLIGCTPGDLVLGIRVINKEGGHVSLWRSLLRLIGYIISTVVLFLGFIWAVFDRSRQGWHDKLGATIVLYDYPAIPAKALRVERLIVESESEPEGP